MSELSCKVSQPKPVPMEVQPRAKYQRSLHFSAEQDALPKLRVIAEVSSYVQVRRSYIRIYGSEQKKVNVT